MASMSEHERAIREPTAIEKLDDWIQRIEETYPLRSLAGQLRAAIIHSDARLERLEASKNARGRGPLPR
jgi:hypothetical protein